MLIATLTVAVTVIGFISASVRAVQTHQSPTVTGVSHLFAWLGLAANGLWFAYGLREGVLPQVLVSIAWGSVFGYIIWRLNDRHVTARMVTGMLGTVTASAAIAFIVSGELAGWLGGLLILGSTAPQAWKIWRTGDIAGVAPLAWTVSFGIGMLWTLYGYLLGLLPVLVLNAVYVLLVAVILAGIVRARRTATLPSPEMAPAG